MSVFACEPARPEPNWLLAPSCRRRPRPPRPCSAERRRARSAPKSRPSEHLAGAKALGRGSKHDTGGGPGDQRGVGSPRHAASPSFGPHVAQSRREPPRRPPRCGRHRVQLGRCSPESARSRVECRSKSLCRSSADKIRLNVFNICQSWPESVQVSPKSVQHPMTTFRGNLRHKL